MKQDQAILKGNGWTYWLDGQEVTQAEFEKRYPPPKRSNGPSSLIGFKPLASDACGICPEQIPEAMEVDRAHGLGHTRYTPDGRPIFTSRSHRAKYLKSRLLFDRDAGYSDPAPTLRHPAPEIEHPGKEFFD